MKIETGPMIAGLSIALFLFLFFYAFHSDAAAHDHVHGGTTINYNYDSAIEETLDHGGDGSSEASGESRRGISNALCLGMTNFDYDRGWQVSGGASWWKDENSGCIAFGTMVDEVLIVGGGACDTGAEDCAGAVSFSTHF